MLPRWLISVIFFGTLALIAVAQVYWYRRARALVVRREKTWVRWLLGLVLFLPLGLVWVVYAAGTANFLLSFLANPDRPRGLLVFLHTLRQPEVMIPVGLWSIASGFSFLFIKLVQAPSWLVRRFRPVAPNPLDPERRYFLQTATYLAGAAPFAVVGYGFLRRQLYAVEEVNVPIANLPSSLDSLRLVLLTDVHASAYMPIEEVRRVVAQANELEADLVFHTGDFITSRGDPLDEAVDELARVRSRYGLYGCLGNHEIYAVAEAQATRRFRERNCTILRKQAQVVEVRGASLNLIGVDYERQPRGSDPEEYRAFFLRGVEPLVRRDMPNILLTHNPNPFLRAAELGIELTLAGHTHGGQVQVEILDTRLNPARFITRFISGLYQRPVPSDPSAALGTGPRAVASQEASATGSSASSLVAGHRTPATALLYVSRGIGTIATPIRVGAPPEITLLTLRRA